MKVNIDQTIEVSDERRKQIALAIDGPGSKKRDATRQELKDFLWNNGAEWEAYLDQVLEEADLLAETDDGTDGDSADDGQGMTADEDLLGGSATDPEPEPEEDLLGAVDDGQDLLS